MNDQHPPGFDGPDRTMALRILDALPQAIFWKDRESVYMGCNVAFAAAVGLADPQEIVGKTDFDLPTSQAEAEAYRQDDREVIATEQPKHGIIEPMRYADGRHRQVETTKIPLVGDDGGVVGVLGIYSDVTDRQRRAVELREARHMLQVVLDTIPVRVFWKDRESVYLGCNRLFATDAGIDGPAEIVGRNDTQLGWREQSELYRADDKAVMDSGEPKLGYEEPQTTPDGGKIWLRTSKIPLRDPDEKVIGVLGTYEDITDSKRAEEDQRRLEAKVQHAQKLESLGILAGGIAHDFNNLLVAILGHADLALTDLPPSLPGYQNVEEIRTAAKRARELTNQMLAYSGKGHFVVRHLQLNDVVTEMGHLLEASIPKKVNLHYELAEDLPAVEVDAAQIRQVVMNLVTNAAEAIGGSDGRITLATGRRHATAEYLQGVDSREPLPAGTYVYLEVSDDGEGMDPETRARLFEPFFTTKFQGRGLGLAAVQGIVRGHAGAIKVHSEPGQGSCFEVLIPANEAPIVLPQESTPTESDITPLTGTVLLVDDEEVVRQVVSQMLKRLGLDVLAAADGAEALELFKDHRQAIRLILLDMTMPRMDGEETFRELMLLTPDVRIILSSGYSEQDATSRFVGKGLAGFIQKPFTLVDLEAKIREVLD